MARYVSAEKQFDCYRCHIICTVREMRDDGGMMCCPNCDWMILFCPNPGSSVLLGSVSGVYYDMMNYD